MNLAPATHPVFLLILRTPAPALQPHWLEFPEGAALHLYAFEPAPGLGFWNHCVYLENSSGWNSFSSLKPFQSHQAASPPDLHVPVYGAHASILAVGNLVVVIYFHKGILCKLWYP